MVRRRSAKPFTVVRTRPLTQLIINTNFKSQIMSAFKKLKELVAAAEADAAAFYNKGNKAAGKRLRKAFQEIKNTAQQGRAEVLELKAKEQSQTL
jgi:vacuolar-type H+-ATPase subunit H